MLIRTCGKLHEQRCHSSLHQLLCHATGMPLDTKHTGLIRLQRRLAQVLSLYLHKVIIFTALCCWQAEQHYLRGDKHRYVYTDASFCTFKNNFWIHTFTLFKHQAHFVSINFKWLWTIKKLHLFISLCFFGGAFWLEVSYFRFLSDPLKLTNLPSNST